MCSHDTTTPWNLLLTFPNPTKAGDMHMLLVWTSISPHTGPQVHGAGTWLPPLLPHPHCLKQWSAPWNHSMLLNKFIDWIAIIFSWKRQARELCCQVAQVQDLSTYDVRLWTSAMCLCFPSPPTGTMTLKHWNLLLGASQGEQEATDWRQLHPKQAVMHILSPSSLFSRKEPLCHPTSEGQRPAGLRSSKDTWRMIAVIHTQEDA